MITQAQLSTYINPKLAAIYYPILEKEMFAGGIDTKNEQCAFLAEIINEGLEKPSENLYYTAARLTEVFKHSYFPTLESALPYEKNPQKLANHIYGGRMGNDTVNDGWTYRGRGPIGLTGREMYTACGKAIDVDLIAHPELLEQPRDGVKSAVWFWNYKKLSPEAEAGNIDRVSRGINIGNVNSKTHAINEDKRHLLFEELLKLSA